MSTHHPHHCCRREFSLRNLLAIFLVCLSLFCGPAGAQRNVSVDDVDPAIQYVPAGAWGRSVNSSLDFGFAHMLTQNENATATFNFTGIAIYFLSPRWPYLVNTAISLDGAPSTLVDLVDHTRPDTGGIGPETVMYEVVWSRDNLTNTSHTLRMSVGEGQPFAIVDGLLYTVLDLLPPPDSSTEPSPGEGTATSPTTDPSNTPPPPPPINSSGGKSSAPVAVGAALGVFGLLLIALFVWFCLHKRNKRPQSEAWTTASSSYGGQSKFLSRGGTRSQNSDTTGPSPISLGPPATYPGSGASAFGMHQQHPYNSVYAGQGVEDDAWRDPRHAYLGVQAAARDAEPHTSGAGDSDSDFYGSSSTGSRGSKLGAGGLVFPYPPNRPTSSMSHGRYTPGVALSTISENSAKSMASRSLSVRESPVTPAGGAKGADEHGYFGVGVGLARSRSGNILDGVDGVPLEGREQRLEAQTPSPPASSLAARIEQSRAHGVNGLPLSGMGRDLGVAASSSSGSSASGPLGARGIPRF